MYKADVIRWNNRMNYHQIFLPLSRKQKQQVGEEKQNTNKQLGLDNKQASVRAVEIMSLVGNRITLQKRKDWQNKNKNGSTILAKSRLFLLRIRDTDLESSSATMYTSYLCPVSLSVHLVQCLSIYILQTDLRQRYNTAVVLRQSHDLKVTGLSLSKNGGSLFFSQVNFLCWLWVSVPPQCYCSISWKTPGILPEVTAEHACIE